VNQSRDATLADGLTAGNIQWIRDTLGPDHAKRLVSAEALLVSFRSRKTAAEIAKMRDAVQKTERILAEAELKTEAFVSPEGAAPAARRGSLAARSGWARELLPCALRKPSGAPRKKEVLS